MSQPVSDFGMKRLSMKELGQHLAATIQFGGNLAMFGRRGSGKTHISKHEISRANMREIYINASVFERVDFGGYPDFKNVAKKSESEINKYIDFLMPGFYKHLIEGNKKCVVLLDEVDKADPSVWAPLLEFTQFHTMNGKALPNLQAVIMTGNLTSEGGQRPCLPLLDRAEKYIVEADVQAWLDWAGSSRQIHPSIAAYINDHPDDLYGDIDPGEVYADPSPRGWHNASKMLYFGEENRWSTNILTDKVAGCVGKPAGLRYSSYYNHYQVLLPLIEMVFKGMDVKKEFDKLEPSKRMVASMITCARYARKLDEAKGKIPDCTGHVAKFMLSVDDEMALIAIRSQITLKRILENGLDDNEDWDELITKISSRLSE